MIITTLSYTLTTMANDNIISFKKIKIGEKISELPKSTLTKNPTMPSKEIQ